MSKDAGQDAGKMFTNDKIANDAAKAAEAAKAAAATAEAEADKREAMIQAAMRTRQEAQQHLERGEYEAAVTSGNSLIAMDDREAQWMGHFYKASGLEGLGRNAEAIASYSTALEGARAAGKEGTLELAYLGRGKCYLQQNDIGAALRDFSEYVRLEPRDDKGYYWQAVGLERLGDLDQALRNIERAISIRPGDAAKYRVRASIYEKQGNAQKAIEDLSHVISLEPKDATTYSRRAALYAAQNDPQRAIADYSRVIELDPQNLESYKARANLYQLTGDTGKAAADLAHIEREESIRRVYGQYLQAATTAYDQGIKDTYTEADLSVKPNWTAAWLQIGIVVVAGLLIAGLSYAADGLGIIPILSVIVMVIIVVAIIVRTRTWAPNRIKAATAYLQMRKTSEAQLPGFEEFFKQFLQAKKESKLEELPARTRGFLESRAGGGAIQAK
ncbi:MAG: tetratricopeptide repeat protein [Chloroflexota bacterium]|nr:tetratricopeptide repeat protein [Chloroflexota bacterium]MDQ5867635.1 tetratricopeptide repeat protein [Chloroflexota bacterium]